MPLTAGSRLGPYEILSAIGAGGMGEVYQARDTKLDRGAAIKVLAGPLFSRCRSCRSFRARSPSRSPHCPIRACSPSMISAGPTARADAVMELLDGETLRERILRGPQPPRRAVDLAVQIARGLAAAHDAHRPSGSEAREDLCRPEMAARRFSISVSLVRSTSSSVAAGVTMKATDAGTVLGTVGYMSPEQVRGLPADARSDIFALGAIVYELRERPAGLSSRERGGNDDRYCARGSGAAGGARFTPAVGGTRSSGGVWKKDSAARFPVLPGLGVCARKRDGRLRVRERPRADPRSIAAGPPVATAVGASSGVRSWARRWSAFFSGGFPLPLRRLASRATTSICRQAPRWSRLRWRSRPTAQRSEIVLPGCISDAARIAGVESDCRERRAPPTLFFHPMAARLRLRRAST